MLKTNPTSKWLDKKIQHYLDQDDKTMAQRFLDTYGHRIEGYDYAKTLKKIQRKVRRGRR